MTAFRQAYYLKTIKKSKTKTSSITDGHVFDLQWRKLWTGMNWLKEQGSKLRLISTLSPASSRTAARFSSTKTCHCRAEQSSRRWSSAERWRACGKHADRRKTGGKEGRQSLCLFLLVRFIHFWFDFCVFLNDPLCLSLRWFYFSSVSFCSSVLPRPPPPVSCYHQPSCLQPAPIFTSPAVWHWASCSVRFSSVSFCIFVLQLLY